MRTRQRSSRLLVVIALATVPLACGADHGSLGDLATDSGSGEGSGSGGESESGSGSGTDTTPPACGAIPLADMAAGIGGFIMDGEEDDYSGCSVSLAGDFNGDGLADIVVAAPGAAVAGRAYVVFGKPDTHEVSPADVAQGIGGFAINGATGGDWAGSSVSGGGDVNGDGLADVIVGANAAEPNGPYSGRTYVVFGQTDTEAISLADVEQGIGGFAIDGEAEGDNSGANISTAGDVNGDGLTDVIVGSMWGFDGLGGSDLVYVVFGKTSTDTVLLADVAAGVGGFALEGEAASGYSVGGAGDVNGDGLADVVVGAPRAFPAELGIAGRTYVVFGKADPEAVSLADVAEGTGGFVLDAEAGTRYAGFAVGAAGDVNGDGLADVVLGAPFTGQHPTSSSRAYVVFGKTDTQAVALADVTAGIGGFAMDGSVELEAAGYSVSGAGDMNGDGLADVIVGAYGADGSGVDRSGRAYVVFGKASTEMIVLADVALGIGGFAMDGEVADDNAGRRVAGGGDTNGDGIPDLIVGAARASPNGLGSGRTYVVFGGDFSCAEGGG